MKPMPTTAIFLAAALLLGMPAVADDVHLTNGKVYEDVSASTDGTTVTIRLGFGTLRIPANRVERIDAAPSSVEELLVRERALEADVTSSASDWLELAIWSRDRNLSSAARRAALVAAEREPGLEGLAALLTPAGYRLDEELGRWIPLAEWMGRRGLVLHEGEWISREEQAARLARDRAEGRAEEEREAARRLRIATETLAQAALLQAANEARERPREVVVYTGGSWWVPAVTLPARATGPPVDGDGTQRRPPPSVEHPPRPNHGTYRDLARRQPGSFLPLGSDRPPGGSSGSSSRQR